MEEFNQSMRHLKSATQNGNIAAFSRSVGVAKPTLWELVQGHFPPSLPFLLQLCFQFRLSLLQLLLGREYTLLGVSLSSKESAQKRGVRRPFDHKNVQKAIEDILADEQSASLSMRQLPPRLAYPVRTIKTHFP